MHQLNGIFSQSINYKYKRVGHLFQGRYIILNPVRANMVDLPDEWLWNSSKRQDLTLLIF